MSTSTSNTPPAAIADAIADARRGHRIHEYEGAALRLAAVVEEHFTAPTPNPGQPEYVYVASSWRNPMQPTVIQVLKAAGIPAYDFRNPEGGTGFSWREVKTEVESIPAGQVKAKGSDWEQVDEYLRMVEHPRAIEGFEADFAAMQKADTFVMVLPCGKSAHLELGWAIGAGKRTAILLEDPVEPELMYRMADHLAPNVTNLLAWLTGSAS